MGIFRQVQQAVRVRPEAQASPRAAAGALVGPALLRRRLPAGQEVVAVLALCVTLVGSWSIYHFLANLPGWLFYLSAWDILGIFAYSQVFALLESLLVLLAVLVLAAVLPRRIFLDYFTACASTLVLVSAAWAVAIHINGLDGLPLWPSRRFMAAAALYVGTIVGSQAIVHRWRPARAAVSALAQRVPVFLFIYIPLAVVGMLVVIIRNF